MDHWLSKSKSCPTCKKTAHKSDVRNLYAPSSGVVVADSTHLQGMQDKLENANTELAKQKQINAQLNIELKKVRERAMRAAIRERSHFVVILILASL